MTLQTVFSKKLKTVLIACVITVLVTCSVFYFYSNNRGRSKNRVIFLLYQTTVSGSEAGQWASSLATRFPAVSYFEASTYLQGSVSYNPYSTGTTDIWTQIIARLANKEGDILLVDKEKYQVLLQNGFLSPLSDCGYGNRAQKDETGGIYGVDVTGLTQEGLTVLDTDENAALGKPKRLEPVADEDAVIAVIYKNSIAPENAHTVFQALFGGCGDA